jgi:hypothetical protein
MSIYLPKPSTLKKQDSIKLPPINPSHKKSSENLKDLDSTSKEKNTIDITKPLRPFIYEEFLKMLTVEKINYFVELTKQKEIESTKRNMKLKKSQFISIMKNVFPTRGDYLQNLFEQFFQRFKTLKAEIKLNPNKDSYFVSKIYNEEEIDIYEICLALAIFIKTTFENKIRILFNITDVDDDGFINENELKKLIFTINYLFCEEDKNFDNESSLCTQSIISLKCNQNFQSLMKFPGELEKEFIEQKYVNFETILNSMKKIYNYKFEIFPIYQNLKKTLLMKRNEKDFEIKQRVYNDFCRIGGDIINKVKKNGIGASYYDFKKNLTKRTYNFPKKNFSMLIPQNYLTSTNNTNVNTNNINNNNNNTNYNMNNNNNANLNNQNTINNNNNTNVNNSNNNNINNNNNNNINVAPSFRHSVQLKTRNSALFHSPDIYTINFNKICGLETFPKRLKIIETSKTEANENDNINNNNTLKQREYNLVTHLIAKSLNMGYMTNQEILNEIEMLSNKHKLDDQMGEELVRIGDKVKQEADSTRNVLKNKNPNQDIMFGKVEDKNIRFKKLN